MVKPIDTVVGPIWYPTYETLPRDTEGKLVVDDTKMVESLNNLIKLARLSGNI